MAKKMSAAEKVARMKEYEVAYEAANPGKRVRVVPLERGWYRLEHSSGPSRGNKYRLSKLIEMTMTLERRAEKQGE